MESWGPSRDTQKMRASALGKSGTPLVASCWEGRGWRTRTSAGGVQGDARGEGSPGEGALESEAARRALGGGQAAEGGRLAGQS